MRVAERNVGEGDPLAAGIGLGAMVTGRLVSRTGWTAIFPSVGLIPVALLLVLALTLALFRKLPLAFRSQAARQWAQDAALQPPPLRTIRGARVLVVGLGGIGAACASRFAALGADVTGIRRRAEQPAPEGVTRVGTPEDLHDLLPSADVVVRSKWMRFCPTFACAPGRTSTWNLVASVGTSSTAPTA